MRFFRASIDKVTRTDTSSRRAGSTYDVINVPVNLDHALWFTKTNQSDWEDGAFIRFKLATTSVYWAYNTEEERDKDYAYLLNNFVEVPL